MTIVAAAASSTNRLRADERFDKAIGNLVDNVSQEFDKKEYRQQLIVGSFALPTNIQSGGGLALQHRIAVEFEKRGFRIIDKNSKQIRGEFEVSSTKLSDNDNFKSAAIKVIAMLVDEDDRDLKEFSINIFGETVLPFSGATVSISAALPESQRQGVLTNIIESPPQRFPGAIEECGVRSDAKSPFAIEVHVLKNGVTVKPGQQLDENDFVPLRPMIDGGQAKLQIPRDRLYMLKLTNDSDFEAAVGVYIDTLSMFAFSDDGRTDGKVIVPPRKSAFVKGWFRTANNSNAFSVGTYSESAAARQLVNPSETGTITATFAACWEKDPPADELLIGKSKGDGTKIDIPIRQKYEVVKRHIGKVRSAVTVHYNR